MEYIDSLIIVVGTAVFSVVCVIGQAISDWSKERKAHPNRRRRRWVW